MRKVLLFFPSYRSIEAAPPLALLALAPVLERQGYRVEIIDSTIDPQFQQKILDQIDESICLGISIVTGPMIEEAIQVSRAVKAKKAKCPVIFGGWHPSTLANQTLGAPYVDIVVRGQGELTLGEIVPLLEAGETLEGIEGCSFKRPNGEIVHNPNRKTVYIQDLPSKSYHLIDFEPYAKLSGRRWIAYTSSHGCPYDCSYCSNASLYGRAWNALPAQRVVAEMTEVVRRFRLDLVVIIDDNFLVDRQRGIDIARGIVESGERFDWCIQTTANFRRSIAMGLREPRTLEEWAAFYPKFQRLPWLDEATHQRIQRIREYIRIGFGAAPVARTNRARQAVVQMLAPAARFRLRRNQY